MSDLSHITELVGVSPLSDADKKKILSLAEKKGEAAALTALDEKMTEVVSDSVTQHQANTEALDATVAALADEFSVIERELEKGLIAELQALPEGPSKERDRVWEAYYSTYDEARALHEEKVRATMARLVGQAGAR